MFYASRQDMEASDSMQSAIDAMRLNPIIRRGVSLVRGVEIDVVSIAYSGYLLPLRLYTRGVLTTHGGRSTISVCVSTLQ